MSTQNNWWRCNKCQVLTAGGRVTPGACQAGAQHDHSGSGELSLVHDDPAAPGQSDWKWCNRCNALTFAGGAALGPCPALPAGQPHDHAGSPTYAIELYASGTPTPSWRHCAKCQAMTWWTGGPDSGPCSASGQHDHTGSGYYLIAVHDRREPIDQAIARNLLTEFGPCNDALQARATLQAACNALIARGGGVIVIPDSVPADFIATSALQDTASGASVLIEDYRGGALRLVVPPVGPVDIYNDTAGGITVEREMANDIQGQGGGAAVAISQRSRGGVNSINDVIQQDVAKGPDARFYVNSLRGLCPGNWFNIAGGASPDSSGPIKALGLDGDKPYFVADAAHDYPAQSRYWNKNWFGALDITEAHNTDDQSGTVSIERATYGSGDSFGVQMTYQYSSDIMSAGGDEGGVLYSGEVRHDVELFWGEVESWDPATQTLVYKDQSAAVQKPENWWKIGTSRPIVNMNPAKWTQSGKVIIPQNGFDYNGIPSAVIGNANVQWDASIIGKFITIDEPTEYWDPASPDPKSIDHAWSYMLGSHIVRRWFRVATLAKRADGLWNLGIETVWWGNYVGGRPALMNAKNYTTSVTKELSYIIAPGSWAIDVRNALGPRKYYLGATPQERTIRLAPVQNAADAFAPGDPIAQPAGPTPWTPTAYRTRQVNLFPPLMAGSGFIVGNLGPTAMGAGLMVDGPHGTLAAILDGQKDGAPSFATGLTVSACSQYALYINGPVLYAAMFLDERDGNKKIIEWQGSKGGAAIYGDPVTGDFTIETSGNVNLSHKATMNQAGLSATPVAARNLRGIDLPVPGGAATLSIAFATPEPDASYAILVQCSWLTATAVQSKTSTGFTVMFDKPAAPGATLDWFLVR